MLTHLPIVYNVMYLLFHRALIENGVEVGRLTDISPNSHDASFKEACCGRNNDLCNNYEQQRPIIPKGQDTTKC